jgi:hypothetical protein
MTLAEDVHEADNARKKKRSKKRRSGKTATKSGK